MQNRQAFGLQYAADMTRRIVGIVAALALVGCGAGVDDPEAETAAYGAPLGTVAQGMVRAGRAGQETATAAGAPQVTRAQASESPSTLGHFDSSKAAPQDPVPERPVSTPVRGEDPPKGDPRVR